MDFQKFKNYSFFIQYCLSNIISRSANCSLSSSLKYISLVLKFLLAFTSGWVMLRNTRKCYGTVGSLSTTSRHNLNLNNMTTNPAKNIKKSTTKKFTTKKFTTKKSREQWRKGGNRLETVQEIPEEGLTDEQGIKEIMEVFDRFFNS